jgi:hypothetical protein
MSHKEGDTEENGPNEAATWKYVTDRDGRGTVLALLCNNCGDEISEPGQMCDCQKPDGDLPPDPEGMNEQRASAAGETLAFFAMKAGELGDDNGLDEQNLTDLLADLAHYCDREEGLNLTAIWERARTHYEEETGNQGKQFEA